MAWTIEVAKETVVNNTGNIFTTVNADDVFIGTYLSGSGAGGLAAAAVLAAKVGANNQVAVDVASAGSSKMNYVIFAEV